MAADSAFSGHYLDMRILREKHFYIFRQFSEQRNIVYLYVDADGSFTVAFEPGKKRGGEDAGKHCNKRAAVESDAGGDTDNGGRPHDRGCGKTGYHFITLDNYHSRAEKADARNDLCRDTERIAVVAEDLSTINSDKRGHCAAETDKNMGPHARLTAVAAALKTDNSPENNGENYSERNGKDIKFF